ncbi:MAG TPA: hypothetical protein VJS85_01735, partial [Rhizomicrobium sp.]|nr:hypothetical protein [Rhizomicrobium sp.]
MRATSAWFVTLAILLPGIAAAQSASPPAMDPNMPGMKMDDMPGMAMPGKKPMTKKAKPKKPAPAAPQHDAMPGMTMPQGEQPAHADMPGHHDMPGNETRSAGKPLQEMSHDMPGMDMGGHGMAMHGLLGGYAMSREASGTNWQPQAAPHSGIQLMAGDWMVMLHGRASGIADWQSGPRGGDQVFS